MKMTKAATAAQLNSVSGPSMAPVAVPQSNTQPSCVNTIDAPHANGLAKGLTHAEAKTAMVSPSTAQWVKDQNRRLPAQTGSVPPELNSSAVSREEFLQALGTVDAFVHQSNQLPADFKAKFMDMIQAHNQATSNQEDNA